MFITVFVGVLAPGYQHPPPYCQVAIAERNNFHKHFQSFENLDVYNGCIHINYS